MGLMSYSAAVPADRFADKDRRARAKRLVVLLGVLAAHCLLVLLLVLGRRAPEAIRVSSGLQVLSLDNKPGVPAKPAAARSVTPEPPKPAPAPTALTAPPPVMAGVAAGGVVGASVGVDGGCAMSAAIARAIEADAPAAAALLALPPEVRTSADAVMIWNSGWLSAPAADGSDGLLPVRQVIERVFAASETQCVEAKITGPQFIPISVGDRTMMLVVGSGDWAWKEMVESGSYGAGGVLDASRVAQGGNISETTK